MHNLLALGNVLGANKFEDWSSLYVYLRTSFVYQMDNFTCNWRHSQNFNKYYNSLDQFDNTVISLVSDGDLIVDVL